MYVAATRHDQLHDTRCRRLATPTGHSILAHCAAIFLPVRSRGELANSLEDLAAGCFVWQTCEDDVNDDMV